MHAHADCLGVVELSRVVFENSGKTLIMPLHIKIFVRLKMSMHNLYLCSQTVFGYKLGKTELFL